MSNVMVGLAIFSFSSVTENASLQYVSEAKACSYNNVEMCVHVGHILSFNSPLVCYEIVEIPVFNQL